MGTRRSWGHASPLLQSLQAFEPLLDRQGLPSLAKVQQGHLQYQTSVTRQQPHAFASVQQLLQPDFQTVPADRATGFHQALARAIRKGQALQHGSLGAAQSR